MRRRDIKPGSSYACRKLGQVVTCRVIDSYLFGFLLRVEHIEQWDPSTPEILTYGWIWSWQVVEEWNPF